MDHDDICYYDISSVENHTGKITPLKSMKWRDAPSRARRGVVMDDILLSTVRPNLRAFGIIKDLPKNSVASTGFAIVRAQMDRALSDYLINILRSDKAVDQMVSMMGRGAYPSINQTDVKQIKIPLPPLKIQKEIVAEIEGYQKIIDGVRSVVDNYKPHIQIDPEWEMVEVGEICEIVRGSSPRPKSDTRYYGGNIPRLMVADLTRDGMYSTPKIDSLTEEGARKSRPMKKGDLIMAVSGQPGLCTILDIDACIHDGFAGFRNLKTSKIMPEFAYHILMLMKNTNDSLSVGAIFKNLNTNQLRQIKIPLPPLETQNHIIARIEKEQVLVNANKELIVIFEQKIKDKIASVWGE